MAFYFEDDDENCFFKLIKVKLVQENKKKPTRLMKIN
jgi:hypothetical protein